MSTNLFLPAHLSSSQPCVTILLQRGPQSLLPVPVPRCSMLRHCCPTCTLHAPRPAQPSQRWRQCMPASAQEAEVHRLFWQRKHPSSMLPLRPATRLYPTFATTARRTFASTARIMAAKQEWLIILPDHAGALEQRMKVRPYVVVLQSPRDRDAKQMQD